MSALGKIPNDQMSFAHDVVAKPVPPGIMPLSKAWSRPILLSSTECTVLTGFWPVKVSKVMSTNWADYLILVYSVPFWEAATGCLGPIRSASSPVTHRATGRAGDSWTGFYLCDVVRVDGNPCSVGRVPS